jgi:hypothetical protein
MTIDTECCYAECHLCGWSFMLSVANKYKILSITMLNIVMLSVIILSVVAPFKTVCRIEIEGW